MNLYEKDLIRYQKEKMPSWQKHYRKLLNKNVFYIYHKLMFFITKKIFQVEISSKTKIGGGVYFGHPYGITINQNVVIGDNCNIHKGVTIGQENRGKRKGCPTIGNYVWIGVNATIVGKICIGNNVLIAPNSFVNRDIPDNSIVFGNPCIVKQSINATEGYINSTYNISKDK